MKRARFRFSRELESQIKRTIAWRVSDSDYDSGPLSLCPEVTWKDQMTLMIMIAVNSDSNLPSQYRTNKRMKEEENVPFVILEQYSNGSEYRAVIFSKR